MADPRLTTLNSQLPAMAHKKGQGSVKNGRDSVSERFGVKKFGSEAVIAGDIHYPAARNKIPSRQERRARARLHDFCPSRRTGALRPGGTACQRRAPSPNSPVIGEQPPD